MHVFFLYVTQEWDKFWCQFFFFALIVHKFSQLLMQLLWDGSAKGLVVEAGDKPAICRLWKFDVEYKENKTKTRSLMFYLYIPQMYKTTRYKAIPNYQWICYKLLCSLLATLYYCLMSTFMSENKLQILCTCEVHSDRTYQSTLCLNPDDSLVFCFSLSSYLIQILSISCFAGSRRDSWMIFLVPELWWMLTSMLLLTSLM